MFSVFADYARLFRAGWTLSRRDALIPHEFAHLAPAPVRMIGALSRIGANRKGRPGERLAHAFERLGPAYVKLGQFVASSPTLWWMSCNRYYCNQRNR